MTVKVKIDPKKREWFLKALAAKARRQPALPTGNNDRINTR